MVNLADEPAAKVLALQALPGSVVSKVQVPDFVLKTYHLEPGQVKVFSPRPGGFHDRER